MLSGLVAAYLLAIHGGVTAAQSGSLQDLSASLADKPLPTVTIYKAREIITLDPARATADAVAVVGDRILATGTLAELKAAIGDQKVTVDEQFADKVIVPGFIGQHDHPLLAGLTMIAEIISIEDWVLPTVWGTIMEGRVQPVPAAESTISRSDSPRTPKQDLIVAHYARGGWAGPRHSTPTSSSAGCSPGCSCRLSHALASLILGKLEAVQP